MKKSKRKPVVLTELKEEQKPIDPTLLKNVNALRALVTTHSLLNEGFFPKPAWPAVHECQEFIKSLHSQLSIEALSHPDASRVDELRAIKEKQNGQN